MENFELIEAYQEGWMNEEQRQAFEARLRTDKALQQDYQDWLSVDQTLRRQLADPKGAGQLEDLLQPLTRQHFSNSSKTPVRTMPWRKGLVAAIAAAVLLLIWMRMPAGFERFTTPEMPATAVRGVSQPEDQAAASFNEGNYTAALRHLKAAHEAKPDDATTTYFLGLCYLKTGDYATALPLLNQIADSRSVYRPDAAFFTALAAYRSGDQSKAALYADRVPASSPYYKNAVKLLDHLR